MAKSFCYSCKGDTEFTVNERMTHHYISDKEVIYREKYCVCNECGGESEKPEKIMAQNDHEVDMVCNGLRGAGIL